jgi:hypothetical protein
MNNCSNGSSSTRPLPGSIHLSIQGLGHVPSFKNQKSIYRKKDGTRFIATKADRKAWMESAIQSIQSQLLSEFQTTTGETLTAHSLRSWIASCVPLDDSWQWVPEIHVKVERVKKGDEGAEITIIKTP